MPDKPEPLAQNRLDITLQRIVYDVVNALGYVGAMVATYEAGDVLVVRAFHIDNKIASANQIRKWEEEVSRLMGRPISLFDPEFSRVHVNQREYQDNLIAQAVKKRKPVVSDDLYALFTPMITSVGKPMVRTIQQGMRVRQVVAVPFFLESSNSTQSEIVGNIFALKEATLTQQDIAILTAFGRQAAAAIEIERHRQQVLQVAKQLTTEIQARIDKEDEILKQIVFGVVNVLGYVIALVATFEKDGSLPVRSVYINPDLASTEQVQRWEQRISMIMRQPMSITNIDPDFARVYVYDDKYKDNLSVQAVKARKPIVSDELFSLFTPVLPLATKPIFNTLIQRALGIKQVIAVPFFLTTTDGETVTVGNLFAATTKQEGFQQEEIELLQAFGQQAAAGIRNARLYREVGELYAQSVEQRKEIEELYRKAEERRQVAEVLGKMAFSAATNIHALRNHIGAFSVHLQLLLMYKDNPEMLKQVFESTPMYAKRLKDVAKILESLHEPWISQTDEPVDVNRALELAVSKANDLLNLDGKIVVEKQLAPNLPRIPTAPEMLSEGFRIVIKNGMEAIMEKQSPIPVASENPNEPPKIGSLRVETRYTDKNIEVFIRDDGSGIPPEYLQNIFGLRWSTKETGLGFGLFWLKDYIEGLGGKVSVESELGVGTTFCISLPAMA